MVLSRLRPAVVAFFLLAIVAVLIPAHHAAADTLGDQIATLAEQEIGAPYVFAGDTPAGWDCSGMTMWLAQQVLGISIPHGTDAQFAAVPQYVAYNDLQPGDFVYFAGTNPDDWQYITHVGVYVGNNMMVNAENENAGTVEVDLGGAYWQQHYAGAGRFWGGGAAIPSPPGTTDQPGAPGAVDGANAGVASAVHLRGAPSLSATILATLQPGERVALDGTSQAADGYTWDGLTSVEGQGWAASDYLIPDGGALPPPPPDATAAHTTTRVNLRANPGTDQPVLAILAVDTAVTETGQTAQASGYAWDAVQTDQGNGWIADPYLAN